MAKVVFWVESPGKKNWKQPETVEIVDQHLGG